MRILDPERVGRSECRAWSAYYRRDWAGVLLGALGMVRHGFGVGPVRSVVASWYVLRANQAWAPEPDNDPARARRQMARFYALMNRAGRLAVDPEVAADLEVSWWQVHRRHQHDPAVGEDTLVDALVSLYGYVHGAPEDDVRRAAVLRVRAMGLSDAWVRAGRRLEDPLLVAEQEALIASYAALAVRVVHRSG